MSVNERTILKRVIVDAPQTPAALPMTDVLHEAMGPGPLDGEIITTSEVEYVDASGSLIRAGTPIVRDASTGKPVALWNSFMCDMCRRYNSITFLAEYTDEPEQPSPMIPQIAGVDPNPAGAADANASINANGPKVRHGVCVACHDATKWSRRFAMLIRCTLRLCYFIVAPFLPPKPGNGISSNTSNPTGGTA